MTRQDLLMVVADCCADDIESIETVVASLNCQQPSWASVRGCAFGLEEVSELISELLTARILSPIGNVPNEIYISDIDMDQVGSAGYEMCQLWFKLTDAGRGAIDQWWESSARERFDSFFNA